MKIKNTLSIAFASIVTSSFVVAPLAYATTTNHSGAICKGLNHFEAPKIYYFERGAVNMGQEGTAEIICPLTRNSIGSNGAIVYVDIEQFTDKTTTCTVYSHDYRGNLLGSNTRNVNSRGVHDVIFNLQGAGKSNAWSDYSVKCTIPVTSTILGIDLVE